MKNTGVFYVQKGDRLFRVEPISKHADRNADWGTTDTTNLPEGGAIHPDDSIIRDGQFKNIMTLGPGISPLSAIDKLCLDTVEEEG